MKMQIRSKFLLLLVVIITIPFLDLIAQEDAFEPNNNFHIKVNKKLLLIAQSGISKKSYLFSAGIQIPKFLAPIKQEKELFRFNLDFAGMVVRMQKNANTIRPSAYFSLSFTKNVFSVETFNINASNVTISDFGKNEFADNEFINDNKYHFEVSNLTGISFTKYLLNNRSAKIIMFPALKISNVQNPDFGYIVTIMKSIPKHMLVFIKADNSTSIGHRIGLGVMYII